jgi:ABC-type Fe3+/spermidine/putrescine transport system ATPase subunit
VSAITLKNLTKKYHGETVLQGISLDIGDQEFVALVGPSGCGKTTTLKIIAGLVAPDQGEILIDGSEVTLSPVEKRPVVMVFQEYLLFPHLTVGENITFGLKMSGCSKQAQADKLHELLSLIRLPDLTNRYPAQLSGGQQQRVSLARALALEPKVLLLDEPFSNLDPHLREEMRDLICQIHRQLPMSIIFVTHDVAEAMPVADRIAVMFDGRIVQYDTPYDLYNRPATREIANLFGVCNTLSGTIRNHIFSFGGQEQAVPEAPIEGEVDVFLRAESIRIGGSAADLTGIVRENSYTGGHSLLKIAAGDLELVACLDGYCDLRAGAEVRLSMDWRKAHFKKPDGIKPENCLPPGKKEARGLAGRTVAAAG